MKLKSWVEKLLIGICFVSFMILASDCESTTLFIISKIIATTVILINTKILAKNNDIFE